jgi:hypothetical protein
MPLSPPAERDEIHLRRIEIRGYRRRDGLWDIEAHLTDTKTRPMNHSFRGTIPPGEPMHDMWVRLTVDDKLLIHGAEAASDMNPYPSCAGAAPSLAVLKGHRIAPGWNVLVRKLLGGVKSCTHLMEVLTPLATTAYQAMATGKPRPAPPDGRRPPRIDSCWAYSSQREVVARFWPDFYDGP